MKVSFPGRAQRHCTTKPDYMHTGGGLAYMLDERDVSLLNLDPCLMIFVRQL
jgi:hypothetical protein